MNRTEYETMVQNSEAPSPYEPQTPKQLCNYGQDKVCYCLFCIFMFNCSCKISCTVVSEGGSTKVPSMMKFTGFCPQVRRFTEHHGKKERKINVDA
jgi:hypothetical protein